MDYVSEPYPGYRLKPEFNKIISQNPIGGGRILKDPNGRPSGNILAAFYLGCGPHFMAAVDSAISKNQYPGKYTQTTFDDQYDPYYELERMRREGRNN